MTCCYSAHTGNEVSSCVGGVAKRPPSVCVCFGLEEAVCFGIDCGLPVDIRWLVGT